MPTGYTDRLFTKQQTFDQFVWSCARAFGALVTMRDDDSDAPVPERFEPDEHTRKKAEEYKQRYDRLAGMTPAERRLWGKAELKERIASLEKSQRESDDNRRMKCYRSMLEKVNAWTPPTEEHAGLKTFMVEQITESIKFDSPGGFYEEQLTRFRTMTPESCHASAMAEAARMATSYAEYWREEVERTDKRNAWLKALRESLQ